MCQKWRRPHLSTESIHQTRYKTYFGGDDDDDDDDDDDEDEVEDNDDGGQV